MKVSLKSSKIIFAIKKYGSFCLLMGAIALSIVYLFYGIGSQRDQFYWMSLFDSFATQPMTALTLWVGQIWSRLFSLSILSSRVLKWILEMSSFALVVIIIPKSQRKNCMLPFTVAILLMGYGMQNEYSPTVLTNFFLVALAFLFKKYKYSEQPLPFILLLAIISGLTISARFPNIVILIIFPFAILCQVFYHKHGFLKRVMHIVIYLTISIVAYWVAMSLLTSSIFAFSDIASVFSSTAVGSHSVQALYKQYLWSFSGFFSYVSSAFLFFIPLFIYRDAKIGIGWKTVISIISATFFCLFYVKTIGFHKWNNGCLYDFISASVIACACYGIYASIKQENRYNIGYIIFLIVLCFVPTVGSDTRFYKLFPVFTFFLPLFWESAFSYHKNDLYFLPLPMILSLCAIICYSGNPINNFDSSPLWKCSAKVETNSLKGIKISDTDRDMVNSIMSDSEKYDGLKIVYGAIAHYISIISERQIQDGQITYNIDYHSEYFREQIAEYGKKATLFLCKDIPIIELSYLTEQGYDILDENSMYYILQYAPSNIK